MKFLICFIFLNLVSCTHSKTILPYSMEKYEALKNFVELKAKGKEGIDYVITFNPSNALNPDYFLMTLHGGKIEAGTTELAQAVLKQYSLKNRTVSAYDFSSLHHSKIFDESSLTDPEFHLTSARNDDPILKREAMKASHCLSLHGFKGDESDFCLGGRDHEGRDHFSKKIELFLSQNAPELKSCTTCCGKWRGEATLNPVNFCKNKGIQIEMSQKVRLKILKEPPFKEALSALLAEIWSS